MTNRVPVVVAFSGAAVIPGLAEWVGASLRVPFALRARDTDARKGRAFMVRILIPRPGLG